MATFWLPFLDTLPRRVNSTATVATIARTPTTTRVRLRPANRIRNPKLSTYRRQLLVAVSLLFEAEIEVKDKERADVNRPRAVSLRVSVANCCFGIPVTCCSAKHWADEFPNRFAVK